MATERNVPDLSPNPGLNSSSAVELLVSSPEQAARVLKLLQEDIKAADLKWSLFIAASHSYRYETYLKPFPPNYCKDEVKDFDGLIDVISKISGFVSLLQYLEDPTYISTHKDVIELLYFVLVSSHGPCIKTVRPEDFDAVLKKVPSEAGACRPQFIFEVVSTQRSQAETKWKSLAKNRNTFFAYHGSKLENFHSILNRGLQQHLNKTKLFGSGIYFSSELSVSLLFSPSGLGWGSSGFGPKLGCVAVCELIDNVDGIYYKKSKSAGDGETSDQTRSKVCDSMGGEVPHKYYVVTNNDLVRLRYLLVYSKDPSTFSSAVSSRARDGTLMRWFSQHKLLTVMFGYSFMLATIGFANNSQMQYYYRMFLRKVDTAIKGLKF